MLNGIGCLWIDNNARWERVTQSTTWDISGTDHLLLTAGTLSLANHQSWVDVLKSVAAGAQPEDSAAQVFPQAAAPYVPFMGLAWWRSIFRSCGACSKEYLARHPGEQRDRDLIATQSRAGLSQVPTSVLIFWRTRTYRRQITPASGRRIATFCAPRRPGWRWRFSSWATSFRPCSRSRSFYPDGVPTFWEFLCNRCRG